MRKLYYFPPVVLAVTIIFLCILSWSLSILPFVFFILPLFLSSFLLEKGNIFGIIPAIALGIYIIIEDLKQQPRIGPSFPELGVIIIIYYLICAFCALRIKLKQEGKTNER